MLFEGQKGGSIYNLTKQWAMRDHTASEVDQADETDENKWINPSDFRKIRDRKSVV